VTENYMLTKTADIWFLCLDRLKASVLRGIVTANLATIDASVLMLVLFK